MPGKVLGFIHRAAIVLMLMTAAIWLALLSVVFAQWFAAGTDQWSLSYSTAAEPDAAAARIQAEAEAARVEQMWEQRLALAMIAGPGLLAVLSLISGRRGLRWFCFGLAIVAAVIAVYLR
ncbi:hypothetical protein [Allorhizocola rhizosphaerae]|uniref:hypothetical protein n=1 Tax=Allorhizocola rhizosphaerae TaxID=1872709 RepID=UPI000E3BE93A|nr:hypothetical protein [Allorhizocola rhizosphaerae]